MSATRILALVWPTLRGDAAVADRGPFEAMLDRLDDLSPRVEAVDRGVALVDIAGLGALVGDERRVVARAVGLVEEVARLPVRIGIGDNRWLAVLAARLGRSAPGGAVALRIFPPHAAPGALADLPLSLLPADPAVLQRFALFGLRRMGELAALPRSSVGAQFGAAGERLQQLARGEDPRSLVPRRRPERLTRRLVFEPAVETLAGIAIGLRNACAALCDELRTRHLAPGRARLVVELEGALATRTALQFPEPALEPEWIARLLISRLEADLRDRRWPDAPEEPRIAALGLAFDRLSDPAARQLPAFEVQAGRWEELRWSLERIATRFGAGRLATAVHERPAAARAEHRARLIEIGTRTPP